MKIYIIEVIRNDRVNLIVNQGIEPFWTLDFTGTITREQAVQQAIDFLKERGERLVQLFPPDWDKAGVMRYRIAMD